MSVWYGENPNCGRCGHLNSRGFCNMTACIYPCETRKPIKLGKEFLEEVSKLNYPRSQTNADRIRAMTDEELAEWLERIRVLCANDACGQACPLKDVCYSMAKQPTEVIDWLKQEVGA